MNSLLRNKGLSNTNNSNVSETKPTPIAHTTALDFTLKDQYVADEYTQAAALNYSINSNTYGYGASYSEVINTNGDAITLSGFLPVSNQYLNDAGKYVLTVITHITGLYLYWLVPIAALTLQTIEEKIFTTQGDWLIYDNSGLDISEIVTYNSVVQYHNKYQSLSALGGTIYKDLFTVGDTLKITITGLTLIEGTFRIALGLANQSDYVLDITTSGDHVIDNVDSSAFGDGYVIIGVFRDQSNVTEYYLESIKIEKYV